MIDAVFSQLSSAMLEDRTSACQWVASPSYIVHRASYAKDSSDARKIGRGSESWEIFAHRFHAGESGGNSMIFSVLNHVWRSQSTCLRGLQPAFPKTFLPAHERSNRLGTVGHRATRRMPGWKGLFCKEFESSRTSSDHDSLSFNLTPGVVELMCKSDAVSVLTLKRQSWKREGPLLGFSVRWSFLDSVFTFRIDSPCHPRALTCMHDEVMNHLLYIQYMRFAAKVESLGGGCGEPHWARYWHLADVTGWFSLLRSCAFHEGMGEAW